MSFELGESLRRCGLETGGRAALLEALATYTDDETGLASVSQMSLALHARLTERHARRILALLVSDVRLEGLVRVVSMPAGRGRAAVYRLQLERVEPLAAAMKIAQRACHAGVAKALASAGLIGAELSPHNIRRVFGRLKSLCEMEGQRPAAMAVAAQEALFEAALAAEAPGRLADGSELPFGRLAARAAPVRQPCGKPVESVPKNPDILSQNPDISSSPHYKDTSTSRINPFTREPAREAPVEGAEGLRGEFGANDAPPTSDAQAQRPRAEGEDAAASTPESGELLAAAATAEGAFLIDPEALLGFLPSGREAAKAFIEAFRHRPARITPLGVLAIAATGEREAFVLSRDWLAPLTAWAAQSGLSGVVFERIGPRGPP